MPTKDHTIVKSPSAYDYPLLLKQLLVNALTLHADQEITYRGEVRHDYAEMRRRIGRLANVLAGLGVKPGDTVAVLDWDSHRYLECYFAVPMMGATLFTVNVRLSPQQILYTLNDSAAEVVVVHADFLPLLEPALPLLQHVRRFVLIADGQSVPTVPIEVAGEYEKLLAAASESFDFEDLDENTKATTFYTTGTTGDPKGVYYSHRQIVLHSITSAAALCSPATSQRLHREDVYMPITPMFHVMAWGMPYLATALGLKMVFPGRYLPEALLDLYEREKVTFSHCVPTVLQMLLGTAQKRGIRLDGWKMIIGGSALPVALARAARAMGIDVWSGYGMSETGPIATLAQFPPRFTPRDEEEDLRLRTYAGRPTPLVDLRVVDPQMADVPRDGKAQGEIVLRSPWLTMGYHKKLEASEELWKGGYLHTQDVAVWHPNGFVQIVDRIKDVIKTGGEWVSSLEVENLISQVPGVAEVAVVGVRDERWGERPAALVVKAPNAEVDAETIRSALLRHVDSNRISKYAVPEVDRITFVAEIPKTSVGKIDKKLLRDRHDR